MVRSRYTQQNCAAIEQTALHAGVTSDCESIMPRTGPAIASDESDDENELVQMAAEAGLAHQAMALTAPMQAMVPGAPITLAIPQYCPQQHVAAGYSSTGPQGVWNEAIPIGDERLSHRAQSGEE